MRRNGIIGLLFIGLAGLMSACGDDNAEGKATFRVRLTDSPADYDHIYIDIEEVRVHTSVTAEEEDGGWQTLDNINAGVYDLLELTGGIDTVLASMELPAGRISQVRLVLGSNNSIVVNGVSHDLKTPSAQQSGLKLNVQAELSAGLLYDLLLDFDAARSIVRTGNGQYILKPVIRAIPQAQGGSICGTIAPIEADPVIYAIQGSDSTSTYPDDEGKFCLRGLEAGTYEVFLLPSDNYQDKTIENVSVSNGQINDLGTISLNP